jgi:hypothetical protein
VSGRKRDGGRTVKDEFNQVLADVFNERDDGVVSEDIP